MDFELDDSHEFSRLLRKYKVYVLIEYFIFLELLPLNRNHIELGCKKAVHKR